MGPTSIADAIVTWVCCAWQTCSAGRLFESDADTPVESIWANHGRAIVHPSSEDCRSRDVIEVERHGCVMENAILAEKGIASTRAGRRCRGDSEVGT